jgi:hypothetical protein
MHLLTKILSQRLYNVNLDSEFASTSKHNMSDYFTGNRHSTQLSHAGSSRGRPNKARSRHQSIHGDPRVLLNRSAGRPISSGSSGQLVEPTPSERSLPSAATFSGHSTSPGNPTANESPELPEPKNSSASSLLGGSNLITRSFKAGDRRSTPFVSTNTAVAEGRSKDIVGSPEDVADTSNAARPTSGGIRFGLKSIIPNAGKLLKNYKSIPLGHLGYTIHFITMP